MQKKNTRRHERSLAFQVLYAISFANIKDLDDLSNAFYKSPDNDCAEQESMHEYPKGFAWDLVKGVWTNSQELDELITQFSHNWRVDRMGRIELTVLRMGLFEMLYKSDIPTKVAINEALELAKQFGEQSALAFINGILDSTAKALESGQIQCRS